MCHANNDFGCRLRLQSGDVRQCQIWISFVLCFRSFHFFCLSWILFFISCWIWLFPFFSLFGPSHLNSTITFYLVFGSIFASLLVQSLLVLTSDSVRQKHANKNWLICVSAFVYLLMAKDWIWSTEMENNQIVWIVFFPLKILRQRSS